MSSSPKFQWEINTSDSQVSIWGSWTVFAVKSKKKINKKKTTVCSVCSWKWRNMSLSVTCASWCALIVFGQHWKNNIKQTLEAHRVLVHWLFGSFHRIYWLLEKWRLSSGLSFEESSIHYTCKLQYLSYFQRRLNMFIHITTHCSSRPAVLQLVTMPVIYCMRVLTWLPAWWVKQNTEQVFRHGSTTSRKAAVWTRICREKAIGVPH